MIGSVYFCEPTLISTAHHLSRVMPVDQKPFLDLAVPTSSSWEDGKAKGMNICIRLHTLPTMLAATELY